uniref:Uncharacterized protein n=1 Tax=Octopus bimaculoides TaxID=37653 RepID=A0A0L8FZS1_OCTBM
MRACVRTYVHVEMAPRYRSKGCLHLRFKDGYNLGIETINIVFSVTLEAITENRTLWKHEVL